METIKTLGREILDSRGNPTVEAGAFRTAAVGSPDGSLLCGSSGEHEPVGSRESCRQVQPTRSCPRTYSAGECERKTCSLKGMLVEWFELISLAMFLLTGILEHVLWLIRWIQEVLHGAR
jgi:hypothetical protein